MYNRKEHYSKKGLYSGYDKNHKERDALDYYATPPQEVTNILETLNIDFSNSTILEPCVGGGHMYMPIKDYIKNQNNVTLVGADVADRGFRDKDNIVYGNDFFDDNFCDALPTKNIDYIIMNPPYATIEPFVMKSLGIANKGILMLGRLQFLEGQSRYANILKDNSPTEMYIYVDRIACYKSGDFSIKPSSAQAYAWFYWDMDKIGQPTETHWIRRFDKRSD